MPFTQFSSKFSQLTQLILYTIPMIKWFGEKKFRFTWKCMYNKLWSLSSSLYQHIRWKRRKKEGKCSDAGGSVSQTYEYPATHTSGRYFIKLAWSRSSEKIIPTCPATIPNCSPNHRARIPSPCTYSNSACFASERRFRGKIWTAAYRVNMLTIGTWDQTLLFLHAWLLSNTQRIHVHVRC